MKKTKGKNSNRKNASKRRTKHGHGPPVLDEGSPIADDDELDFTIHQERLYGQTAEPLTVRAIINRIGKKSRSSTATLSAAEGAFLARFEAAEDRGAFIENSFLRYAIEGGTTLKTCTTYFDDDAENERGDDDADKEREASGCFGLHRFLGKHVCCLLGAFSDDLFDWNCNAAEDVAYLFYSIWKIDFKDRFRVR